MEVSHSFFSHSNLLVLFMFFAAVSAADLYSQTLLSLKSELTDDYYTLKDWYVPSGENPSPKIYACSWSGVKCNNNSVTGLDLSMKRLSGSISGDRVNFSVFTDLLDLNLSYNSFSGKLPVSMFTLANLTSLDISRNNFSGQFPAGVSGLKNLVVFDAFSNSFSGSLPVEVSQLQNLKILNLAGSYFKGPIPQEYGNFQSLQFIHLAGNMLNGNIPPELGKLKTVTHMEIGYNTYQGGIPWQLGNMSQLQYLDIAYANLSESIPRELGNLTKLESLFLFRNQLSGSIPVDFSKLQSLISLDLSDNLISGPISDSLLELKNLKLLSLFYNEMSGVVPEGIAELPSLESLLIWNNYFSGNLPQNLGRNSNLMWVDVSTNNFNGSIPPDICVKGVLFKLMLFSNNFSGSLAPSLSNCSSLVRLRLEDNSFSGEIPLRFSHLRDLSYVDLSKNKLTGGIPIDIDQAPKLEYFNMSNNPELGGTIPAVTWSLPLLQNFSASSCSILGNLPPFGSCKSISVIELNMNSISGAISESVSNCLALERIDLANNNLSGHIPEELASLPALRVLDLSHNSLNGPIPSKFGSSSSLSLLNVSFNDISGTIPSGKVVRTMGSSAFVGNSRLCGEPLRSCPSSVAIFGSRGIGRLIWVLLLCAGIVMFLTLSVLGVLYFQKGSRGQWKMVSFSGLPQSTAKDVLKSFNSIESMDDTLPPISASVCKAVLPTGITVSVKKLEWDPNIAKDMLPFITQIGNARHKNLIRLLGFCYNKHLVYLLYDYLPNGSLSENISVKREWAAKYKIVVSIARGLCFLHHECHPAIAHGDLRSSNIVFDETMEPHLTEFGLKHLLELNKTSGTAETPAMYTGATNSSAEELYRDVYSFGEIMLEILTNGKLTNSGASLHNKSREIVLRDIINEHEVGSNTLVQEEIKWVLEVATLCTRIRSSDRPSMKDTLKLLQAP
ncbi:hypothetical protein ACLB2K_009113 [Fragaria x ananassa]